MRHATSLPLLASTALALILVNGLRIDWQAQPEIGISMQGDRAAAKSSGGRARSGSFQRRSSPSRSSSPSNSSPSRSNSSRDRTPSYSRPYRPSAPVIVPVPYSNPAPIDRSNPSNLPNSSGSNAQPAGPSSAIRSSADGFPWGWLFLLGGAAFIVLVAFLVWKAQQFNSSATSELDNDIVTVTKLQVALLAQARDIQDRLSQLSVGVDLETPAGLAELLQETTLALLRSPENWTHGYATSQTVKSREAAATLFEQFSIEERSKFSAETLVNVGGRIRRQALPVNGQSDPAAYIVVTLLVGSENDRPLITDAIHSTAEMQAALQHLGAISPDYLLIFEVLWSPQDSADSLSYDELLTEYPGMVQL